MGAEKGTFKYHSLLLNDYSQKMNGLIMINKNTTKIILHLLKEINEHGHNINQVAKALHISTGSAFKILTDLEKDNILYHEEISNASHYKLNLNNQETIKLCELLLLQEKRQLKGHAKLYADELSKFNDAELIILFGSILKGTHFNDVDALFLTNQVKKVQKFCLDISKLRTKPVMPLIITKEELIREIKNKKEAILSLIKEGIVLHGTNTYLEVLKNVYS